MVKKYRKKPVVIEAIQWTGDNVSEILSFVGAGGQYMDDVLCIYTLEGVHHARVEDYIIKGVRGEFYPCKPDIFEMTYESADTENLGSSRPKGRWIEHEYAEEEENGLLISNFECSNCHTWERKTSDYCPNCGAEMEE